MEELSINFLHNINLKRDGYGFALRPQHTQRYREYANIYKEEEYERLYKWRSFLDKIVKNPHPFSSEKEHKETLNAEGTEWKEETVLEKVREGDNSSGRTSFFDVSEKELHCSEERKTHKVQTWAEIRPFLGAIGYMMSSHVKKRKDRKGDLVSISNESSNHLPAIEELGSLGGASEEDFEEEVCIMRHRMIL
ncbi:TBC1 domain family member 8B [Quillaja saponaria]|uniref:TBC1 domain family member 8B n=1 Tax=Quillaja saponaria TaxID=32244 RepID=A0AAD7VE47_QUISA|nr:TBC1 domain family member 8B [Quillaja saponaria]